MGMPTAVHTMVLVTILCNTIAATPVALHSVAHTVSQQIPATLGMLRGYRATSTTHPQKRPRRTHIATPPVTVSQRKLLQSRYTVPLRSLFPFPKGSRAAKLLQIGGILQYLFHF